MENYVTISYSLSLILLFLCVIFVRIAANKNEYISTARYLLRLFGVVPGFIGVILGIYLQLRLKDPAGIMVMTAWLILELGSVQLLNILKKLEKELAGSSEPA